MAENILLFSNSLAFISSLCACIKINISILTTTLRQLRSISLLVLARQVVESKVGQQQTVKQANLAIEEGWK